MRKKTKKHISLILLLILLCIAVTPFNVAASETVSSISSETTATETGTAFGAAEESDPPAMAPVTLPASYDPRITSPVMVTPVKSQIGDTCWAYGAVATLESYILKHTGTAKIYSENYHNYFTASNAFNSGSNPNAFSRVLNGTGQSYFSLHNMINWNGPVLDSQFPASITGRISPAQLDIAPDLHVQGYEFFSDAYTEAQRAAKVTNMKRAIYENGAVATAMISGDTGGTYYKYPAIYRPNTVGGSTNHVIAHVGWDDNYAVTNFSIAPPGPGAFIMKNSWGTGSGNNGYFYVSYYDRSIYEAIGVSVSDVEPVGNYDKNYSLNKTISTSAKQILGLTAANLPFYVANVFTRDQVAGEYLEAVGVFLHGADMPYEVYINPGGSTLNSSALILAASGTSSAAGYITIPVSRQQLTGAKFAVAVKMRSHTAYPTIASDRKASTGESFMSTTNLNAFIDNGSTGHFLINAYTKLSSSPPPLAQVDAVSLSGMPGLGNVLTGAVTLTAPIAGPLLTYRWQRSADQVQWLDIPGAAASTYIPVTADSSQYIRLGVKGTGTNVSAAEKFSLPVQIPAQNQGDDNADIAAVALAIENATYIVAQAGAADMAAANAAVASVIGSLNLNGVTATITDIAFTAAIAGTVDDGDGTNGSYSFTVNLSKGNGTPITTAPMILTILAAPYQDTRLPLAIRAEKVDSSFTYGTWMKTDLQTALAPCTWKNNSASAMPLLYTGTVSLEVAGRYYFVLATTARWSLDGNCKVIALDVDVDGNVAVQGYNMNAAALGTANSNGKISYSPNDPSTLVVSWGGIPAGHIAGTP